MADLEKQNHLLDKQASSEQKVDNRIDRSMAQRSARLSKRKEKKNKGNS
jgi:hypothetical protein